MSETPPGSRIPEELYCRYFDSLLVGDRVDCTAVVNSLLEGGTDIRELYLGLFQRSMYQVGDLWEGNRISVAKEHLATVVTEGVMAAVYPWLFAVERVGRSAVVSCIANEYHQIGGRMVADIFELNGWDGWFLGANTPDTELLSFLGEKKPDLLCLSLAIRRNVPGLTAAIEAVRGSFPQLDIFVGGQAFRWGGTEEISRYPRVRYVASIGHLEQLLWEGW